MQIVLLDFCGSLAMNCDVVWFFNFKKLQIPAVRINCTGKAQHEKSPLSAQACILQMLQ